MQTSGAIPLQVKHSHPRESCKWGILLSFALKEVPLKPNRTLIQVILLMGGLAAQNVGIGTNAPARRLHVAGNLRLDNVFMPGNQAGALGKTLLSQEAGAAPNMLIKWRHGYHPHEHGLRQHSHAWVPNPIYTSPIQNHKGTLRAR